MKGVLSGGRMVWVDKVPGGNQIGGIMCVTPYPSIYIVDLEKPGVLEHKLGKTGGA